MSETRSTGGVRGTVLLVWLVVVPAAVYLPSLSAPFHYDDLHSILRNPHLELGNALEFFHNPSLFDENPATRMYRPVLLLTYAVDAFFWGRNPFGFHLTNLLLHLLVGAALFKLLEGLLASRPTAMRSRAALVGALAFLLHPLATEGVAYVSCRSSQLAALGYLGALVGYLRARDGRGASATAGWLVFAGFSALVAFGSKAITATLPASLVLLELFAVSRRPRGGGGVSRVAVRLLPFILITVGYLLLRQEVMGSTGVNLTAHRFYQGGHELTGGRSVQSNLLTQAVVFWNYVGLTVWPVDLNIAHHVAVVHRLAEPRVWLGVIGIGLWLLVALACVVRRHFLLGLALLWLPLTLSPTSSVVPLNVVMSEHRLYLPLTLFLGLLAAMTATVALAGRRPAWRSRPALAWGLAVLLGAWGARSAWRNADYRDSLRLWGKAVALAPENFRARNYLGNALVARGDHLRAREQYRVATRLYPEHFDTQINLGEANLRVASAGLDRWAWAEGERVFRSVIAREPRHVLARLKLGRLLFLRATKIGDRRGDLDAAAHEFRTVIEMARAPRFRDVRIWARSRLATLEEHRGDLEAARREYRAILAEVPFHAAARSRLDALGAHIN